MRKTVMIVIAILCTSFGEAQDRFFTFVDGWRSSVSVESEDGYQVLGLESFGNTGLEHGLIVNSIDSEGLVTSQNSFLVGTAFSTSMRGLSGTAFWVNDSTMLIAGLLADEELHTVAAIYQWKPADAELSLLHTYADSEDDIQFYSLAALTDTSWVALAVVNSASVDSRIYGLHQDGSVLWTRDVLWGNGFQRTYPVEAIALSSGHIAALFWEIDLDQPGFHDRWRPRLTLMNDTGAILWNRYVGDYENHRIRPGGIVEQEGDVLVAFSDPEYYDDNGEWQGNPNNRVRFERYALNGTLLLQDSLLDNTEPFSVRRSVTQLTRLNDGNFLIGGYHELRHAFLAKVTPGYETIWFERYSPHEYEEGDFPDFSTQILNAIETSDGGFLCTGMFRSDPNDFYPSGIQTAIALKVDAYGCLMENCQVGIEEYDIGSLEMYPNPASDLLRVVLPLGGRGQQGLSLQLIDITGKVVQEISDLEFLIADSEVVFDVSDLPAGLYSIVLRTEEGGVFSNKLLIE